jgi:hypothetical protein
MLLARTAVAVAVACRADAAIVEMMLMIAAPCLKSYFRFLSGT